MKIILKSCSLRPLIDSDAASLASALTHKVSLTLSDDFHFPYTIADALYMIQSPEYTTFGITINNVVIGMIGYYKLPEVHYRTLEFGYWISDAYWGRGILSECIPAVLEFIKVSEPDVVRVQGGVMSTNVASVKVLAKSGFSNEGTAVAMISKGTQVFDMITMAYIIHDHFNGLNHVV